MSKVRKLEIKQIECPVCKTIFERRVPVNDSRRRYCSRECKKQDSDFYRWDDARKLEYSERMKGKGNNNYGNKWSDVEKAIASNRMKKTYVDHPEYREIAGSANRGVKFSEDRILKMCENRKYEGRPHTEYSKKIIGEKSKEKWTPEYLEAHRTRMESLGYWIPKECKSGFEIYYEEANWIGNMIEYFSDDELMKLKTYGMMNVVTNTNGYVRDHIFCRVWGYMKGIPACILRHPVNMSFISTRENIQKGFIDRASDEDIIETKLNELLMKIKSYTGNWREHQDCIEAIKLMESRNET